MTTFLNALLYSWEASPRFIIFLTLIIDKSSDFKSIYIYVAQRINVFFLFDANEIHNTLSTDSGRNLLIHVYRGNLAVGEELLNSIVPYGERLLHSNFAGKSAKMGKNFSTRPYMIANSKGRFT